MAHKDLMLLVSKIENDGKKIDFGTQTVVLTYHNGEVVKIDFTNSATERIFISKDEN